MPTAPQSGSQVSSAGFRRARTQPSLMRRAPSRAGPRSFLMRDCSLRSSRRGTTDYEPARAAQHVSRRRSGRAHVDRPVSIDTRQAQHDGGQLRMSVMATAGWTRYLVLEVPNRRQESVPVPFLWIPRREFDDRRSAASRDAPASSRRPGNAVVVLDATPRWSRNTDPDGGLSTGRGRAALETQCGLSRWQELGLT
jgi:hypothetical protein